MAKRIDSIKRPWVVERKPFERNVRSNSEFYNSREWRKLRRSFLDANPLCVQCECEGLVTPATVADHIQPINRGGERLSEDNLQPMCASCHNKKSARESHGDMG
ncbi:HNH endonuclease [Myroides odoratus]|uniref:Putative HNH nuclease YajD n=1 Tax=Myroides odoratus TaxID=256 RepID=A0A378RQZ9_MYROD|nr:HNH endonuclease signature motif containing protein [Myroides odoratus]QQU04017.1 HNH endonuclease [Myroides odoratus]STZ28597.1 HNH endonuclease [Myroides odoratus]